MSTCGIPWSPRTTSSNIRYYSAWGIYTTGPIEIYIRPKNNIITIQHRHQTSKVSPPQTIAVRTSPQPNTSTTNHHVLLRQLRTRMPRPLQPKRQPMRRLHCSQPSSSFEQHIFKLVDKLNCRIVLGDDVIFCFAQAAQLRCKGLIVTNRETFVTTCTTSILNISESTSSPSDQVRSSLGQHQDSHLHGATLFLGLIMIYHFLVGIDGISAGAG